MTPDNATLNLRDIHLPSSISWWPPAPGWWLVFALILLIIALGVFIYRYHSRRRMHRAALQELTAIKTNYAQSADEQQLIKALSVWLRRVCLSFYPRVDVAGLTGPEWLAFLDASMMQGKQTLRFSEGAGQVLISAPYQRTTQMQVDAEQLLLICQTWLKTLPRFAHQTRGAS